MLFKSWQHKCTKTTSGTSMKCRSSVLKSHGNLMVAVMVTAVKC